MIDNMTFLPMVAPFVILAELPGYNGYVIGSDLARIGMITEALLTTGPDSWRSRDFKVVKVEGPEIHVPTRPRPNVFMFARRPDAPILTHDTYRLGTVYLDRNWTLRCYYAAEHATWFVGAEGVQQRRGGER